MSVLRTLCGEPFCYTPTEAGKITDYQFMELFVKPALRQSRQMKRNKGERPINSDKRGRIRMPTRNEYVATGVKLGGDRQKMEESYDRWEAEEKAKKSAKKLAKK